MALRNTSGRLLCLVAVLGTQNLLAQDAFEMERVVTAPGGSPVARVFLTPETLLSGYQFALLYDSNILTLKSVTWSHGRDGAAVEFFEAHIVPDFTPTRGLVQVGVIFDFVAPYQGPGLKPGVHQSIAALYFETRADPDLIGTCTPLDLLEIEGVDALFVDGEVCFEDLPLFRRGDCNGDGVASGQVTDALFLLLYNFLGGPEPPCLAACDANGDGVVVGQVADAVHMLQFSFIGGPPPVAPFPDCGVGPLATDAALGCASPPAGCE